MAFHPTGVGPLLVLQDGNQLSKEMFVRKVRKALQAGNLDQSRYSGHSLRIGAATLAAAAGVPAYLIKMMGHWTLEAYMLYVHTARETLAAISPTLARSA